MRRIVLIPAYMPDEKMVAVARGMYDAGFDVIIVNDGSPEEFDSIFEKAAPYAKLLCHDKNEGKGEALKTGLGYIKNNYERPYTVVTADADGQHKVEDIIRVTEVAEANRTSLVLGSRKMEGKVPFKSRAGNAITRFVYRLSTGVSVYDTQTGLRAFGDMLAGRLLQVKGSRYEYEMNMLMELPREDYEIKEVRINTVYINGNETSHFNPIRDSMKIYKEIIKFSASSLASFGIDYVLFCLLSALTGSLVFANIFARIVSGTVNFTINKKLVFKSQGNSVLSAFKYIALAGFILICNTFILRLLTGFGIPAYAAKILTEGMLFIFSYIMQHSFVFKKGSKKHMKKHRWAICAASVLIAFTTYISLDTFVLARSYNSNATEINTAMFEALSESREVSDTSASGTQADNSQVTSDTVSSDATADDSQVISDTSASGTQADNSQVTSDTVSSDAMSGDSQANTTVLTHDSKGGPGSRNSSDRGPGSRHNNDSSGMNGQTSKSAGSTTSDTSSIDASASYTGENTIATDNYTITLSEYYENNTKIYVADVTLTSAQYLKTAFANNTYGKNVTATTSSIAQSNDAILAINGDYYGVQESGYVIRNGIVYRGTAKGCDVLCIYADGTMEIVNDGDYTADELVAKGVWQAFTFGPALVENSSVTVGVNTEVGKAMASNPRTAIGIIDANHFVFVVSDGRTSESEGLSLYELATFMQGLGVTTAYNLDGGGSSTMYFNGAVVNNPTTGGSIKERGVSDIIFI